MSEDDWNCRGGPGPAGTWRARGRGPLRRVTRRFQGVAGFGCMSAARTPRRARRPRGGGRYPGTAAWYSVNWLACSEKAWPTIGPWTEPVRIHIDLVLANNGDLADSVDGGRAGHAYRED